MEREHRGQLAGCGRTAWWPAARRIFMLAGAYGCAAVHRGSNVDPMRVAAQARPVSASSAAARSSRRRVDPRCGHARRARPRAARAAPGPPIARGARRPRPAAVRGRRRRRRRTGHLSAQLRKHGNRLREARVADRREHDAIAELLPLALSAGISRRDRPARLRPSSRGAAHRVHPGRCCSARARAGSSPDRARPPDAPSRFARADRAFPGGLPVNRATARAANTHAARGPALPPPSS
jgi:hypothetical protein